MVRALQIAATVSAAREKGLRVGIKSYGASRGLSVATCIEAVRVSARSTSARQIVRRPLENHAQSLIDSNPAVDLASVTGATEFTASIPAPESRHTWSLHASDQLLLQAIVRSRGVRRAFEIGTFNGGTTRLIAETMGEGGRVWTLDLPPQQFDSTQHPEDFRGSQVGREYLDSPARERITQILEDSLTFRGGELSRSMDFVLVDGAHDYEHGLGDTRTAFDLLAPGGIIVWDDFTSYWHGLVRGIYRAAGDRAPRRLAGSNLGIWFAGMSR